MEVYRYKYTLRMSACTLFSLSNFMIFYCVFIKKLIKFQILEAGDDWRKLYPPLKLHESWVRDIRFNVNDSSALVTAGDSIAWWNLDLLPSLRGKKSTANCGGNTTGRRRMSSSGAGLFT